MGNLIACRLSSYGKFQDRAWSHLPELGIKHVEIILPPAGELEDMRKRLADHGLAVSSVHAECDVQQPDAAQAMRPRLESCSDLGAKICFVSAGSGGVERSIVCDRLRKVGDAAAEFGLTVALETHPDLAANGDVARQTMEAVDHPNVRINFDTANIYFYNKGRKAEEELAKVVDYVASVHLKDTNGEYQTWHFPTLGEGVVDFPAVFKMLGARGFAGPYTIELEGIKGVELDEPGQLKYVAGSVAYLRSIGAFD
ncbi:MAG: sugar phosphate isomerase/epimerase family protein [Planctomycetota bacterium]|jgi:inosose dehydratase